jgi:formate hydrogenlyase maturation protein HycH
LTLLTKNLRAESGENINDSAIHTTDEKTATDVVFYLLGKKFVEDKGDIPKGARDVMYYTLAMGHNTGVIDCFTPKLALSRNLFDKICEKLNEGDAKFKLTRIEKFGEIQILKEDTKQLSEVVRDSSLSVAEESGLNIENDRYVKVRVTSGNDFKYKFLELMEEIAKTPQVYCLARRVTR